MESIRPCLTSYLKNPNHRPKHDEIPKPAGHKIAATTQEENDHGNDAQQDQ